MHHHAVERPDELGRLIDGIDRDRTRCDIFGAADELDIRLLNQAASLLGGAFVAARDGAVDVDRLQTRLATLRDQRVQGVTVGIQWVKNVLPVHVFSLCEDVHFLRDLGGESTPYVHRFFAGPIGPGSPPTTFVFRALVNREQAGEYRVGMVKVDGRTAHGRWTETIDLVQTATTHDPEIARVDAGVGALYDRLKPALWWEEVCQAFTREDGNQIVKTFENLIRYEFERGHREAVAQLRRMRMDFIRCGFFGLEALAELWGLTHRRSDDAPAAGSS